MWLPEGTNINETDRMASSLADYIRGHEETEMVSTYIGRTQMCIRDSNRYCSRQRNSRRRGCPCKDAS